MEYKPYRSIVEIINDDLKEKASYGKQLKKTIDEIDLKKREDVLTRAQHERMSTLAIDPLLRTLRAGLDKNIKTVHVDPLTGHVRYSRHEIN